MARLIDTGAITDADAEWYVPEAFANREDPNPFRMLIKPMSAEAFSQRRSNDVGRAATRKKANLAEVAKRHRDAVIAQCVLRVEEYRTVDNGIVRAVEDGAELVTAVARAKNAKEDELLEELYQAIYDRSTLTEGRLGNFVSRPESSPSEAASFSGGDADGAVDPKSPAPICRSVSGVDFAIAIATPTQAPNGTESSPVYVAARGA